MPNLVGAGDSITKGGTPGSNSYLNFLTLGGNWAYVNQGISGNTVAAMITQAASIDAFLIPGINNVLVVWAGTNDMGNSGDTVANTYANLVSYCQARQLAGWKVVVVQMMSRTGNNPVGGETMDADKTAYNALIDAGWHSFASAEVVLPTSLTANGSYAGANFLDGIHPTAAAVQNLIAPAIQTTVSGLGLGGGMGLGVAHFVSGGSTGSSSTVPLPAFSNTTGNLLVARFRVGNVTINSVTDTAGNTYTPLSVQTFMTTHFQYWYCPNAVGNAANVIQANLSGATTFTSGCAWEITGADPTSPFDVQAFQTNTTGTTFTTPAYTTATANEIILGAGDSNVNQTFAQQSGYTLDSAGFPSGAGALYSGAEHLVVSSVQTNITTSMTASPGASSFWGMHSAAFKAASVATPTFSPPAGTYNGTQAVTISCATAGASIFYTTDGSTPTTSSTPYTGPIGVASSLTLKAIATATGLNQSAVGSAAYVINNAGGTGVGKKGFGFDFKF